MADSDERRPPLPNPDDERDPDAVDEAGEESFPASDPPPSYGGVD